MKHVFLRLLFLFISAPLFAQVFPAKKYPKNYFRDPLNIPISLAGNFGELRPNHYHMGLDIRTEKRENLQVFAAADGYISHVKVDPTGFGQAIYITHPNGYTTLYAHLNAFYPALATYIKQQQYNQQTWRIFVDIPPNLFQVKKGDFIAYSGSTGGSQAPHVHFEIRKTKEDINLNPILFGLPIADNTSPVITRLAIYDRTKSFYEQSPRLLPVKREGARFAVAIPVIYVSSPKISFAISAFDTQSGSPNQNGIFEAVMYDNDDAIIGFQMDNISYDNTRNVNAHIDYKTKTNGGPFLQQLSRLPGYLHSIYQPVKSDGVIDVTDNVIHAIRVEVKDAYGNTSVLHYQVQYKPLAAGNWQPPGKLFYPQMLDGYESADGAFYIGEKCLFDSVHINYVRSISASPNVFSAVHTIGAPYIPLQDSFLIRIKPNPDMPPAKKDRLVMERFAGRKTDVQKVQWQNGWASARFRDFGSFQLVSDEEPPVIIPVGKIDGANLGRALKIVFIVKDNMESFKNFRGELDGKWLLFSNDKGKSFVYKFDEHCPPGKHVLKIHVEDEAGNVAEKSFGFTR